MRRAHCSDEMKQPNNLRRRFFLPTLFCAFLRTYMLVHCCKSDVKFEVSFQFVCMNSHGSLTCRSLPPLAWVLHSGVQLIRLNCLLWISIRLFLLSQALPFIFHSSPLTYNTFPRDQYGTGWDWFFFTTLCLLTLADPAMPISPIYVAAGYPLCKPFVNPLFKSRNRFC